MPSKTRFHILATAALAIAAIACAVPPTAPRTARSIRRRRSAHLPFPPGGGNDTIARLVGQQMAASMGQQVLIDNRPGAAGALGAQVAAARRPTVTRFSSLAWGATASIRTCARSCHTTR